MALSSFDGYQIHASDQNLANDDLDARRVELRAGKEKFKLFLRDWTRGNAYIYREQISRQASKNEGILEVDIEDISAFDEKLYQLILSNPTEVLEQILEAGASEVCKLLTMQELKFQVSLTSHQRPTSL